MLQIYLCKGDETLEEALAKVNETDPENRTFALDPVQDRCFVGDERFASAPKLINHKNSYYALRIVTPAD